MKKSLYLIIMSCFIMIASNVYAANTIVYGERSITISAIDADWTWNQTGSPFINMADGIKVDYIIFIAGAAGDKLILTEKAATGSNIFPPALAVYAGEGLIIYLNGQLIKPFLDVSESTLSTGHKVIIGLAN